MIVPRMPFGKHKGRLIPDIPTNYLRWLIREVDLDDDLREAVRDVLDGRRQHTQPTYPPPADWSGIIKQWYGEMTKRYHPDRSGDVRQMQAINHAAERLRELAGVA